MSCTLSIFSAVFSSLRSPSFFLMRYRLMPATSSNMSRLSSGRAVSTWSTRFCPMMARDPFPRPVLARSSWISFSRQVRLLILKSLSPLRRSLLVMDTSVVSRGSSWAELSNTSCTSAPFFACLDSEPEKMISSAFCPRRFLTFCSPSTQRTASEILLFPQPLGPTMTVMPSANSMVVLSAKDLNPCSVKRSNFMVSPCSRFSMLSLLIIQEMGEVCRGENRFLSL